MPEQMIMETNRNKSLDVLIVGAGPAGLMMACQLALHDISFRIIDQRKTLPVYSGALIVHARTLEILHQMGMAEKTLKAGIVAHIINMRFNYKKSFTLDISDFGKGLTRYPYLLMIEQVQTGKLLEQFLNDHSHWVERGDSLVSFTQENKMVSAKIQKADGTMETVTSRYLIGADGSDSLVRNHLRIPFPGKTQQSRLFITDCEARLPLSGREIFFSFAKDLTAGFFPLKGNRWRVDGLIPDIQHEKVGFEEIRKYFGKNIHSGIELQKPQWFSVFRSQSKCAERLRDTQCFLIGDAAHVHSPVGAQGMNTGMLDACNLAWKLNFVISNKATEKLLDSYEAERRPLALNIIRYTDLAYSVMTKNSMPALFFRLRIIPLVMPVLLSWFKKNQHLRNRIFLSVSGIGIHYKNSFLSASAAKDNFPAHAPKPGERLPYLSYEIRGKSLSTYNDLKPGCFYLFIFGKHLLPAPFHRELYNYTGVIALKYIDNEPGTESLFELFGIKEQGCYLVRPDLYIAWRCHGFDEKGLSNYLKKTLK